MSDATGIDYIAQQYESIRFITRAISVTFWNIQDAYRIHPVSDIKENTNGNRKPE